MLLSLQALPTSRAPRPREALGGPWSPWAQVEQCCHLVQAAHCGQKSEQRQRLFMIPGHPTEQRAWAGVHQGPAYPSYSPFDRPRGREALHEGNILSTGASGLCEYWETANGLHPQSLGLLPKEVSLDTAPYAGGELKLSSELIHCHAPARDNPDISAIATLDRHQVGGQDSLSAGRAAVVPLTAPPPFHCNWVPALCYTPHTHCSMPTC